MATQYVRDGNFNNFKLLFKADPLGHMASTGYYGSYGYGVRMGVVAVSSTTTTLSAALSAISISVPVDRAYVELQNLGEGNVYVGNFGVTTSTGRWLSPNTGDGSWVIPLASNSDIYLVSDDTASVSVAQFCPAGKE